MFVASVSVGSAYDAESVAVAGDVGLGAAGEELEVVVVGLSDGARVGIQEVVGEAEGGVAAGCVAHVVAHGGVAEVEAGVEAAVVLECGGELRIANSARGGRVVGRHGFRGRIAAGSIGCGLINRVAALHASTATLGARWRLRGDQTARKGHARVVRTPRNALATRAVVEDRVDDGDIDTRR